MTTNGHPHPPTSPPAPVRTLFVEVRTAEGLSEVWDVTDELMAELGWERRPVVPPGDWTPEMVAAFNNYEPSPEELASAAEAKGEPVRLTGPDRAKLEVEPSGNSGGLGKLPTLVTVPQGDFPREMPLAHIAEGAEILRGITSELSLVQLLRDRALEDDNPIQGQCNALILVKRLKEWWDNEPPERWEEDLERLGREGAGG